MSYKIIRSATEQELDNLSKKWGHIGSSHPFINKPFDKGWMMSINNKLRLVVPNYVAHLQIWRGENKFIVFTQKGRFLDYSWVVGDPNKHDADFDSDVIHKLVSTYDIKKNLSHNTLKTFNELIDEL